MGLNKLCNYLILLVYTCFSIAKGPTLHRSKFFYQQQIYT
ncbi:MAG: hypothetical protein OFPI_00820 [Osedax symbiont Rs2]|nr:MAG: hypothetical protein OFPI_00820 [Osedax symbiont Rs2]